MNDIIEKMARAMYAHAYGHADDFDDQRPEFQEEYRDNAKAALSALEEPSEAMVEAGFDAIDAARSGEGGVFHSQAKDAWIAMIRAAKEGS